MSTQSRRQREKLEREQLVLSVARDLIVRDGLLNLQMSRLADACDMATGTLYQHFTSKEDLLLALTTQGVAEQADLFLAAQAWQAPTRDRFLAVTVADWVMMRRQPMHFRIAQYVHTEVVWQATSEARRQAHYEASQPLADVVRHIVEEAVASGELPADSLFDGQQPTAFSIGCWAMICGMHELVHADGLLAHFQIHQPYQLLFRDMIKLLNGMNWQPLFPHPDQADARALLLSRIRQEVFHDACTEML